MLHLRSIKTPKPQDVFIFLFLRNNYFIVSLCPVFSFIPHFRGSHSNFAPHYLLQGSIVTLFVRCSYLTIRLNLQLPGFGHYHATWKLPLPCGLHPLLLSFGAKTRCMRGLFQLLVLGWLMSLPRNLQAFPCSSH